MAMPSAKLLHRAYGNLYADGIALGVWWLRFFFVAIFLF
jgi:hypothetical protein